MSLELEWQELKDFLVIPKKARLPLPESESNG